MTLPPSLLPSGLSAAQADAANIAEGGPMTVQRRRRSFGKRAWLTRWPNHSRTRSKAYRWSLLPDCCATAALALFISLGAGAAFSQDGPSVGPGQFVSVHEDPAPGDGWFARVEIYNDSGSSALARYSLPTSKGRIVVRYMMHVGSGCFAVPQPERCFDEVEVVDMPEGVTASALHFFIPEWSTRQIFFFVKRPAT